MLPPRDPDMDVRLTPVLATATRTELTLPGGVRAWYGDAAAAFDADLRGVAREAGTGAGGKGEGRRGPSNSSSSSSELLHPSSSSSSSSTSTIALAGALRRGGGRCGDAVDALIFFGGLFLSSITADEEDEERLLPTLRYARRTCLAVRGGGELCVCLCLWVVGGLWVSE